VPARYRNRLEVGEDITLDNPAVREEVAQRRQLAAELERQEQAASRQRQEERRVQEGRERADQAERTRATRQAQARGAGKSSRVAGPSPVNPEKVSLTSTRHQRTKAPT
jgi:small-conductance mechanosensitive channel